MSEEKKPDWMSDQDWQDHQEEVKAFERRNYRHSGGQGKEPPSKGSREDRK